MWALYRSAFAVTGRAPQPTIKVLARPVTMLRQATSARTVASKGGAASHRGLGLDPTLLEEARAWKASGALTITRLPKGDTSYSRSSGPGGQHVNKTESKATTSWPLYMLLAKLPKVLHSGVRGSRYYVAGSDSISISSQDERSRDMNTGTNRQKLWQEILRIYAETVPGETDEATKEKYKKLKMRANDDRIKAKKQQSAKKARRGGSSE
ncbi:hypothetical protein GGTG_05428 [Gaeumannomyces tritici R3-111a-1]|uniref:Prokaryotic-type class I peptide chain release factors domain-containing protein n=1 Tax=Gaeumannomyces tritici (strain R3-111a-1) TaxID=644352 RepID=J3NVW6_GAET3|nr:hypothetical protein GGTG_05428 [Gaeumannomyces tritici R3-111a-1]EJT75495.1 hypothetical protein GGTG_05428 [Gaeumannomyces tritici R3-111a-1]